MIIDFTVLQLLSLTELRLFLGISIVHDNSSSRVGDKKRYGIRQWWLNSSIIHDNICSLIYKQFHPESCHSDTKFSVVLREESNECGLALSLSFNSRPKPANREI